MTVAAEEVQAGYWPSVALAEDVVADARGSWRSGDHLAALSDLEWLLNDLTEAFQIAKAAFDKAEAADDQ